MTVGLLASYVGDVALAGTPRARRLRWEAISGVLEHKEKPHCADRFLGAKYVAAERGF